MPIRDSQPQFQAGPVQYAGTSSTRRPDAISLDYRTAFSQGPVAISDPSLGLLHRAWRARATDTAVYLSRALQDEWEEETLLFSYSGPPIIECDLAFDQNGAAVLVAQRATGPSDTNEIWIYYFDPFAEESVFEPFGEGRNPRIALDNPTFAQESDLLVFYIRGDSLRYRVQSDLYGVEETLVELSEPPQTFLEKVYRGLGYRFHVVLSRRNTSTFRYTLERLSSPLYNVHIADGNSVGCSVTDIFLENSLVADMAPEGVEVGMAVTEISLVSQEYQAEAEGVDVGAEIILISVVEGSYRAVPEGVEVSAEIRTVELKNAIVADLIPEGVEVGVAIMTITRT